MLAVVQHEQRRPRRGRATTASTRGAAARVLVGTWTLSGTVDRGWTGGRVTGRSVVTWLPGEHVLVHRRKRSTTMVVAAGFSMSLDGFIADPDGHVGPLFDWYQNGDAEVPLPGYGLTFHMTRASADHWRSAVPAEEGAARRR